MDYTDFLSRLDNARKYKNYIASDCPFQDWVSHSPPFFVNERGFNCVACGIHGSLEWLNKKLGGTFKRYGAPKRLIVLPKWQKWAQEYGTIQGIADAGHAIYSALPGKQYFFKQRKIEQFSSFGYFGWLDGWNLFPIFSPDHHIVDIVVRGGDGTGGMRYVLRPDDTREHAYLYVPDWDAVKAADTVYVVYGMIDAWALHAIDLPVVTGTTGKSLNADVLWPLTPKRFIIIPDLHEEDAAHNLRNELGWRATVRELHYPDGCKDPDEIRRHHGNGKLYTTIMERS